jgi:hypothetical protein
VQVNSQRREFVKNEVQGGNFKGWIWFDWIGVSRGLGMEKVRGDIGERLEMSEMGVRRKFSRNPAEVIPLLLMRWLRWMVLMRWVGAKTRL